MNVPPHPVQTEAEPTPAPAAPTSEGFWSRLWIPALVILASLVGWELIIRLCHVRAFIVPGPVAIGRTLITDWSILSRALTFTLEITGEALALSVVVGTGVAVLVSQSKWLERIIFPYLVLLQVTPLMAIAPLIVLWVSNIKVGLLICAWIIAFFPIVSNTLAGLKSTDHNLQDLFHLYRASRWQRLRRLSIPSALPYFLSGLRISGGLALVGAVVAEFVAGTGGQGSGLAFRILEAGYQMNISRMFAALALISLSGLAIHLLLSALSQALLRQWHESALARER